MQKKTYEKWIARSQRSRYAHEACSIVIQRLVCKQSNELSASLDVFYYSAEYEVCIIVCTTIIQLSLLSILQTIWLTNNNFQFFKGHAHAMRMKSRLLFLIWTICWVSVFVIFVYYRQPYNYQMKCVRHLQRLIVVTDCRKLFTAPRCICMPLFDRLMCCPQKHSDFCWAKATSEVSTSLYRIPRNQTETLTSMQTSTLDTHDEWEYLVLFTSWSNSTKFIVCFCPP